MASTRRRLTVLLLITYSCVNFISTDSTRRCSVMIERVEPKRINPKGPCSTMEEYDCDWPPSVKEVLLTATEKLGFPASTLLWPDTLESVKDPIVLKEDTFFKVSETTTEL